MSDPTQHTTTDAVIEAAIDVIGEELGASVLAPFTRARRIAQQLSAAGLLAGVSSTEQHPTPTNVVTLKEGQYVVEFRPPTTGETYWCDEFMLVSHAPQCIEAPVVIASFNPVGSVGVVGVEESVPGVLRARSEWHQQ